MYRVSSSVPRFAKALICGAALATLWVNLAPASYYDSIEFRLLDLTLPGWIAPLPFSLTPLWGSIPSRARRSCAWSRLRPKR